MPTDMEARFVRTAGHLKLIDVNKVDRDIAATEAIRDRGVYADVRTLLVGRRRMSHEDADLVLAEMGDVAAYCAICHGVFQMRRWKPPHPCPNDNAPLKPTLAPEALPRQPKKTQTTRRMQAPEPVANEKDPLIGRMIGGYRVDELVDDQDPYCMTYIAVVPRTGDPVMLKVLRSTDATAQKRFLRGARYASLINHPGVVAVVDQGTTDGHAWVLAGWTEGIPLDKLMDRTPTKRLPVKLAVQIAIAALRALDAAHQTGIVHRNIKPGNITVDQAGHVMITNFDKARVIDPQRETEQLTAQGSSLGTPHYMPPEQLKTSKVDYRADLYAFGATLYHMLTGHPPFQGRNIIDVMNAKVNSDPPPVSSINHDCTKTLDHIVQTLLEREADARYPTATHCAVALKALQL